MGRLATAQRVAQLAEADEVRLALGPSVQNFG